MHLKNLMVASAAIVTLSGCVHVSQRAQQIQVHPVNSTILASCKKLGPVSSTVSSVGFMTEEAVNEQAVSNMRDEAAAKWPGKADSLAVINIDVFVMKSAANGIAYQCFGQES